MRSSVIFLRGEVVSVETVILISFGEMSAIPFEMLIFCILPFSSVKETIPGMSLRTLGVFVCFTVSNPCSVGSQISFISH